MRKQAGLFDHLVFAVSVTPTGMSSSFFFFGGVARVYQRNYAASDEFCARILMLWNSFKVFYEYLHLG